MSQPLNVLEQMQQNWFKPDRMIVVYFAASHFNKVGRKINGKFTPFYDDLD